jgi:peroxiredoxin
MVRLAALAACLALVLVWGHNEVALVARDVHPPPLAIGAPAPDFALPGIDGKTYSLASFKDHKVLVVIFTAVHCPTAEVYEARLKSLVTDYTPKDVAFVVIQPNNAKALRLDEMGYTDLGDSLEEMKIRAEHRQFNFPFLYDGETQEVAAKYGPIATPHVFVFDQPQRLRYQGRVDSNPLRRRRCPRGTRLTPSCHCPRPVRRRPRSAARSSGSKEALHNAEMTKIEAEPIPLEEIGADGIGHCGRTPPAGPCS